MTQRTSHHQSRFSTDELGTKYKYFPKTSLPYLYPAALKQVLFSLYINLPQTLPLKLEKKKYII